MLGVLLTLLLLPESGCGSAHNTPEEALETLRTALKEERWDLLYDSLLPELQQEFDEQVQAHHQRFLAVARQVGENATSEQLKREFGFTLAQWEQMGQRERFSAIFQQSGRMELKRKGVNPDYVVNSKVKSTSIRGEDATISLDAGRGHRTHLKFKLVDNTWRFDFGAV
jgi:hypothetical protein